MEIKKESGTTTTTSWIPEKFAKMGKYLELRNSNGEWVNGWKVVSVGARQTKTNLDEINKARFPSLQTDLNRQKKKK